MGRYNESAALPYAPLPVERQGYAYMDKIKRFFRVSMPNGERVLVRQVEEYTDFKAKLYPMAADQDRQYLAVFLRLCDAEDVADISLENIAAYLRHMRMKYHSNIIYHDSVKAVRCLLRHFRYKGFPTIQPSEVKALTR